MATRLLMIHARSPLHAGTGQATAAVDLPIARDRATNYPLLPGSSIKGTLRAAARGHGVTTVKKGSVEEAIFGPETDRASEAAGQVAFSDARVLLLPVRSVRGTFAWATSPYLLATFARDARLAGLPKLLKSALLPKSPPNVGETSALVSNENVLEFSVANQQKVVLEEFDLTAQRQASEWAKFLAEVVFPGDTEWQDMLKRRLCIVSDDTMAFLAQHGTEVTTRVSIDPATGTAKNGQLWTEEHLPAETVLSGVVEDLTGTGQHFEFLSKLIQKPLQFGGKATVGRGRCQLNLIGGT